MRMAMYASAVVTRYSEFFLREKGKPMNKKQLWERLKTAKITCTNPVTEEIIQCRIDDIVRQLKEQGATDIRVTDGAVHCGSQFWSLPKIYGPKNVAVTVKSAEIVIGGMYINKTRVTNITDDGFETMGGYKFSIDKGLQ
jgi:hypothetical protein